MLQQRDVEVSRYNRLLAISLEQESTIQLMSKEMVDLQQLHEEEISKLQGEISHLNAALALKKSRSAPSQTSDATDTFVNKNASAALDLLTFIKDRSKSIISTEKTVEVITNDASWLSLSSIQSEDFPVPKQQSLTLSVSTVRKKEKDQFSNLLSFDQMSSYFICFLRQYITTADKNFTSIFGFGGLDFNSLNQVHTIIPSSNVFEFVNDSLKNHNNVNLGFASMLFHFFSHRLDNCNRGKVLTEQFFDAVLTARNDQLICSEFILSLLEITGLYSYESKSVESKSFYSITHPSQRHYRCVLYFNMFVNAFKAMQV